SEWGIDIWRLPGVFGWLQGALAAESEQDPCELLAAVDLAQPFQHHRHALTAADAHRLQAPLLVVELQRVDQRAGDPGAGHAERVADRDRAAVDVELVAERVDAEVARRRDDLRRERLVDLHEVDVVDGLAGPGQGDLGRLDRAETHDL